MVVMGYEIGSGPTHIRYELIGSALVLRIQTAAYNVLTQCDTKYHSKNHCPCFKKFL